MYWKPTVTGLYLKFHYHHSYNVRKGIVRCLQHRAKAISSDGDAYQEETKRLKDNRHLNNYPESITSTPRNLDRTTENNSQKLTKVFLPYVKEKKRFKRYVVYMIYGQYSWVERLFENITSVKPPTVYNMNKNYMYSIQWSCVKVYKGKTCCPRGTSKSSWSKWGWIVGYGWLYMERKGKQSALMRWSQNNREQHGRIRRLKEAAHIFGYSDLFIRPSIEMNTIWELLIIIIKLIKKISILTKIKKTFKTVVNSILKIGADIRFISPQDSLCIVHQDTWRKWYRRLVEKWKHLEVTGPILTTAK